MHKDVPENYQIRFDFIPVDNVKVVDGILRATAKIGRAGIQEYYDSSGNVIRELRLPEDVEQSTETFSNLPVTLDHVMVTDGNADDAVKGYNSICSYEKGWLKSDLMIHKTDAIAKALTTHRQFSLGYFAKVKQEKGVWVDVEGIQGKPGEIYEYDSIQKDLEGNHLALVEQARAGNDATFVSDSNLVVRYDSRLINREPTLTDKIIIKDIDTMDKSKKDLCKDMLFDMFLDYYDKDIEDMELEDIKKDMGMMFDSLKSESMPKEEYDSVSEELAQAKSEIETLKADSEASKVTIEELKADSANMLTETTQELQAKIDSLNSEIEAHKEALKTAIETECASRLDSYNQAVSYLDGASFDSSKSADFWKRSVVEKKLNMDCADKSEEEIAIRFDTIISLPKETEETVIIKEDQAKETEETIDPKFEQVDKEITACQKDGFCLTSSKILPQHKKFSFTK